jgi:hypothetical protein
VPQRIESIPSARRLISSLRDIGYEVHTAVADLIDNSIDADATRVDVTVRFEGAQSWVRIADNGTGIPTALLNEAMRWGADREYGATELGKYGLGLKTASLSVCRELTVATRVNPNRRSIEIRRWDLDLVELRDQWELERLTPSEAPEQLLEPLDHGRGTVVLWTKLDRILAYRHQEGLTAEHGLARMCEQIEEHLAMVFHRFLSGHSRRVLPLAITINGHPIDAWDPFATDEASTVKGRGQTLTLRHEGRDNDIRVEPYILPPQERFSSAEAWRRASGPANWAAQQGFYIYRGDRLIQSGGWNRLRTPDEHTKLARIAIDIPRSVDSAFALNISKMRIQLPEDLRPQLKVIATGVTAQAGRTYRSRTPTTPPALGAPALAPPEPSAPVPPPPEPPRAAKATAPPEPAEHVTALPSPPSVLPLGVVEAILRRVLKEQPELVERLLQALRDAALASV